MCDLGVGVSVMPSPLYKRINLDKLIPINISFQIADKSVVLPIDIYQNVTVKVAKF